MPYRAPTDACAYMPHMETIDSSVMDEILEAEKGFDPSSYTSDRKSVV